MDNLQVYLTKPIRVNKINYVLQLYINYQQLKN